MLNTNYSKPIICLPTKFELNAISSLSANVQKLPDQSDARKQQEFHGIGLPANSQKPRNGKQWMDGRTDKAIAMSPSNFVGGEQKALPSDL